MSYLPKSGNTTKAGGSNTEIQFNDSDVLNGDTKLTYDKITGELIVTSPANAAGTLEMCVPSGSNSAVALHAFGGDIDVRIVDLDVYGAAMIFKKGTKEVHMGTVGEASVAYATDVTAKMCDENSGYWDVWHLHRPSE